MFWVATAPAPARAWAQRAATHGLEDETAMPNMPVRAQRAEIEKVIFPSSVLVGNDGRYFDFDQPFGAGESGDDEAGGAGKHAFEPASHFAVDRLAVADIGQIDDDAAHMSQLAARFLEQQL